MVQKCDGLFHIFLGHQWNVKLKRNIKVTFECGVNTLILTIYWSSPKISTIGAILSCMVSNPSWYSPRFFHQQKTTLRSNGHSCFSQWFEDLATAAAVANTPYGALLGTRIWQEFHPENIMECTWKPLSISGSSFDLLIINYIISYHNSKYQDWSLNNIIVFTIKNCGENLSKYKN